MSRRWLLALAVSVSTALPVCAKNSDLIRATVETGRSIQKSESIDLADGVYTSVYFSWSGGSGRVSISCDQVTITEGQAYAMIVFGSSAYEYVKANGNTYYPSHDGDTSVFEVPVELNQNNTIIGMTTKMSSPHEIEYTIFVSLEADTDEELHKIVGLSFQSETEVKDAKYFKIYQYNQGITLLEIDMTSDTEKYLIVPEKSEIPAGLDKQMIIIRRPIENPYVASEQALSYLKELGMEDQTLTEEELGSYENLDWKKTVKKNCDLILLSSDILQDKKKDALAELNEKRVMLDIPMVIDRSQDEENDAAKQEWTKVYEVLFD